MHAPLYEHSIKGERNDWLLEDMIDWRESEDQPCGQQSDIVST